MSARKARRASSSTSLSWQPVPVHDTSKPPVGFLGPLGTFTEQALLTQADLAAGELVPFSTMPEVLAAVQDGSVEFGFVAIENSIEGAVNLVQDGLAFTYELLIQREVVLDVQLCLLAPRGTTLGDVKVI